MAELVEEFFVVRAPRKESPNTVAAYRRDLLGVLDVMAGQVGVGRADLTVDQVTTRVLRHAFAGFSVGRAGASVARTWST